MNSAPFKHCRTLSIFIALSVAFLSLGGCATNNPYTGDAQLSKTAIGTGVGAATGAIIGSLVGNTRGALIGAGIGAAAGGLVGSRIDQKEAAIRQQLQSTGVRVVRYGNSIQLITPGNITFNRNSAQIKPPFQNVLNSIALVLQRYRYASARVIGFASNTGSAAHNQRLSEHRARNVGNYLMTRGIGSNRIFTKGYGSRRPAASNQTAAGRATNRRVVIELSNVR